MVDGPGMSTGLALITSLREVTAANSIKSPGDLMVEPRRIELLTS